MAAANNRVYIIGGGGGPNITTEYNPGTDTYAGKLNMPTMRYELSAATVNGKIYALGGTIGGPALNTVEEFDPVGNTWAAKNSMPTARQQMGVAVVDGRIYAIGGMDAGGAKSAVVESYDPATDSWRAESPLTIARYGLRAGAIRGRLYAAGGNDGTAATKVLEEGAVAPGMLPGATFSFTVSGQVGEVCQSTVVGNTVWVAAASGCAASLTMAASDQFTLPAPVVSFTLSKTQTPANPNIGDTVTYLITMVNTGTATIQNISITDTISPVLTSVTTSGLGTPVVTASAGGTLYTWTGQNIAFRPGSIGTVTITGQVSPVCQATLVSNTAYVLASSACASSSQALASNGTSFTVAPPAFTYTAVKQQLPAGPAVGGPVTYRIIVANTGSGTINALTVSDSVSTVIVGVATDQPAPFGPPVATPFSTVGQIQFKAPAVPSSNANPEAQLVLNVPAGIQNGDVMIAAVAESDLGAIAVTAPAGWNLIGRTDNGTDISLLVYWRTANAEPPSYLWTFGAAVRANGGIVAYTGVDPVNPIDDQAAVTTGSGTNHTAPSLVTSVDNDMLVGVFTLSMGTSWTAGVMNERIDVTNGGGGVGFKPTTLVADEPFGAAGVTGPRTATSAGA
ncbi:MAG: hypothetical protein AAB368_02810, partial [bacterium]